MEEKKEKGNKDIKKGEEIMWTQKEGNRMEIYM